MLRLTRAADDTVTASARPEDSGTRLDASHLGGASADTEETSPVLVPEMVPTEALDEDHDTFVKGVGRPSEEKPTAAKDTWTPRGT
jgi:hypothetical protein